MNDISLVLQADNTSVLELQLGRFIEGVSSTTLAEVSTIINTAQQYANQAVSYASTAQSYANQAGYSVVAAQTAQGLAQSNAGNALTSASQASSSANAAHTSEVNAAASANAAANSATAGNTSASIAATAANAALASQTASKTSETNAATSATTATNAVSGIGASVTSAANSATSAAASASSASDSAAFAASTSRTLKALNDVSSYVAGPNIDGNILMFNGSTLTWGPNILPAATFNSRGGVKVDNTSGSGLILNVDMIQLDWNAVAPVSNPTFQGTVKVINGSVDFTGNVSSFTCRTPSAGDNSLQVANTSYVQTAISTVSNVSTFNGRKGAVVLNANDLTGLAPTFSQLVCANGYASSLIPPVGTNNSVLAPTQWVNSAISTALSSLSTGVASFNSRTGAITLTSADVTNAIGFTPANATVIPTLATLASPTFTGRPLAPTLVQTDDSAALATTAYVRAAIRAVPSGGTGGSGGMSQITSAISLNAITDSGASVALTTTQCNSTNLTFTGTLNQSGTVVFPDNGMWAVSNTCTGANVEIQMVSNTGGASGAVVYLERNQTVTIVSTTSGITVVGSSGSLTSAQITAAGGALIASPSFTGSPTAPTATTATNNTQIATTAFVKAQGYLTSAPVTTVFGRTGAVALTSSDVSTALSFTPVNPSAAALTGTPTAPTATTGNSTTQIATTAFVQNAIAGLSSGGVAAGVSSFNTRSGDITLSSSDVTTALGFTPSNAADATIDGGSF